MADQEQRTLIVAAVSRVGLGVVIAMVLSSAASAYTSPCDGRRRSTYEIIGCDLARGAAAQSLMQANLAKLIAAADRHRATGEHDFRDAIHEAQRTWELRRDAECRFTGDMIEGNADTIEVIRCQRASNLARARQLGQ